MVRLSRTDRFQFLHSADVIWLVVNGMSLVDKVQRQGSIIHIGQLVGRLKAMMKNQPMPKLIIVITHQDVGMPDDLVIEKVHAELGKHSAEAQILPVASFAHEKSLIKAGSGLENLINATILKARPRAEFWPYTDPKENDRPFLSFRRGLNE